MFVSAEPNINLIALFQIAFAVLTSILSIPELGSVFLFSNCYFQVIHTSLLIYFVLFQAIRSRIQCAKGFWMSASMPTTRKSLCWAVFLPWVSIYILAIVEILPLFYSYQNIHIIYLDQINIYLSFKFIKVVLVRVNRLV